MRPLQLNILIILTALLAATPLLAQDDDFEDFAAAVDVGYDRSDAIRIHEAFDIMDNLMALNYFKVERDTPRALLLVTNDQEFLFNHPKPTPDFSFLSYDSLVGSDVYYRGRVFDRKLLATFPAVGDVPTIVIGQPKFTAASTSTRWTLTVIHEHCHQIQQSWPGYYPGVNALGLAGNDSTGMWMLNYPFPYDDIALGDAFADMCRALEKALDAKTSTAIAKNTKKYIKKKRALQEMMSPEDYRYMQFQLWQEGIARYIEYRVGTAVGVAFQPTSAFVSLYDYTPFTRVAGEIRTHIETKLGAMSLKVEGRSAFYYVGAAEGIVLDVVNPGWVDHYFVSPFSTADYFEPLIMADG